MIFFTTSFEVTLSKFQSILLIMHRYFLSFQDISFGSEIKTIMSANFYANFYEVLGIDQTASILDIRKAYKNLAKKFHPDKNNNPGTEEKFKLILEAHNVLIDSVERANAKLECNMCCAIFAFHADLAKHQRKCYPKRFKCTYCNKLFALDSDLAEHQSKCYRKQFQCGYCQASYARKKELIKHVSVRHQFKCEICSTAFKRIADINRHEKKCHSLPFECIRCKAPFAKSEELIQHVWQIHKFEYVFSGVYWCVLGCVLGTVFGGDLGVILGLTLGAFLGLNFRYTVASKRT